MALSETISKRIYLPGETGRVNLGCANSRAVWRVNGNSYGTIQASVPGFVWLASSVLTVQISNDGEEWNAIPDGAVTLSAKGITEVMVVRAIKFISAYVSTAGATDPYWAYVTFEGVGGVAV